jgi:hypothetical protein
LLLFIKYLIFYHLIHAKVYLIYIPMKNSEILVI